MHADGYNSLYFNILLYQLQCCVDVCICTFISQRQLSRALHLFGSLSDMRKGSVERDSSAARRMSV